MKNKKVRINRGKYKFGNIGGITLISLVITIIVLIILASVSIYLSLGNNGIFTRAKEAKEATNKQEATDIINLKITTAQMNKYAEKQEMPTLKELSEVLKEDKEIAYVTENSKVAIAEYNVPSENPSSIYTKLNKYPYEFEINSSLQLASVDGIQVAEIQPDSNSTYSYSEQIVGTWVNNKPIYRKVFNFSENVSNYNTLTYYIDKELLNNVENVIDFGGYFTCGAGAETIVGNINNVRIGWVQEFIYSSDIYIDGENNLKLYITYNYNNGESSIEGTAWVEYTKTTD